MTEDPTVYVMGEGVDDYKGLWGTTSGLLDAFGPDRVLDTPLSENAMTGIAAGTAALGYKPILTHQRIDFMLMGMDSLCNHAIKHYAMTGQQSHLPLTIRAIIGRGWGQSIQHAQSFYPIFAHFPGIKIVAPANATDAKGLLVAAVKDPDPVLVIEARSLYSQKAPVPEDRYETPIGQALCVHPGIHLTIVTLSYMVPVVLETLPALQAMGLDAEVIDLRSIKPLDMDTIQASVQRTHNLVIVDITWECGSIAGDIASKVVDFQFASLDRPPLKINLPEDYVGASESMENSFYHDKNSLTTVIQSWWKRI